MCALKEWMRARTVGVGGYAIDVGTEGQLGHVSHCSGVFTLGMGAPRYVLGDSLQHSGHDEQYRSTVPVCSGCSGARSAGVEAANGRGGGVMCVW